MYRSSFKFLIMVGLISAGAVGAKVPAEARGLTSSFIGVGGRTLVPYGWVDFCSRYRSECRTRPMSARDVRLTKVTYKKLTRINNWVNAKIRAKDDQKHWNRIDQWDYPNDGKGDCEDYVLLKRRLLMEQGFPRQALLVTVVKDKRGDGHAVLTVKTDRGEFILDNLTNKIKPWRQVPYRFVKRQSQTDPNIWVEIGEPTSAPLVVSR